MLKFIAMIVGVKELSWLEIVIGSGLALAFYLGLILILSI